MRICRTIALFFAPLLLLLTACTAPTADDAAARAVFEQVRAGNDAAIIPRLTPDVSPEQAKATLAQIRHDYIPAQPPVSVKLVGWRFQAIAGGDRTAFTQHQYTYSDRVLLVSTTLVTHAGGGPSTIAEFRVNTVTPGAVAASAFTLNKPIGQLLFLGALAASLTIMVWAFVASIRTRGFKRKWLWCILAFAGGPSLFMNWTTGAIGVSIGVGLLNSGVTSSGGPLDPWIVQMQIPIGAIVVLYLIAKHRRERDKIAAETFA